MWNSWNTGDWRRFRRRPDRVTTGPATCACTSTTSTNWSVPRRRRAIDHVRDSRSTSPKDRTRALVPSTFSIRMATRSNYSRSPLPHSRQSVHPFVDVIGTPTTHVDDVVRPGRSRRRPWSSRWPQPTAAVVGRPQPAGHAGSIADHHPAGNESARPRRHEVACRSPDVINGPKPAGAAGRSRPRRGAARRGRRPARTSRC